MQAAITNTIDQTGGHIKNRKAFFTVLQAGNSNSKAPAGSCEVTVCFRAHRPPPSHCVLTWWKAPGCWLSEVSFIRSHSRVSSPKAITLGITFQHTNGEEEHKYSIHCINQRGTKNPVVLYSVKYSPEPGTQQALVNIYWKEGRERKRRKEWKEGNGKLR